MNSDFRTRPDGIIEYRYQAGASNKRGYWEKWEPVAIHAARNMYIPEEYLAGLREAGYDGGPRLLDLLRAEGWLRQKLDYLELTTGDTALYRPRALELEEGSGE